MLFRNRPKQRPKIGLKLALVVRLEVHGVAKVSLSNARNGSNFKGYGTRIKGSGPAGEDGFGRDDNGV